MIRIFLSVAAGALALAAVGATALPSTAAATLDRGAAAKQPVTLGYYDGATVRYYDFGPIKLKPGNKLAPIWTFTNGTAGQRNVIDTVPGQNGYSPLWQVNKVTWAAGKTPRTLTSADAVRKIFTSASGSTTVPMSRPSTTMLPWPAASSRCNCTNRARTAGTADTADTALVTSSPRISVDTFSPARQAQSSSGS